MLEGKQKFKLPVPMNESRMLTLCEFEIIIPSVFVLSSGAITRRLEMVTLLLPITVSWAAGLLTWVSPLS